jgi:hypothetical protein
MSVTARPSLGRVVLVRTPDIKGGHVEHAAIVTGVSPNGARIDVTTFPRGENPAWLEGVYPADHPYAGPASWRWPDRVG